MIENVDNSKIADMKLAPWTGGISGPFALGSEACRAFNRGSDIHDLKMVSVPVIFAGTHEPAFWVTYAYEPTEETYDQAIAIAEARAAALIAKFNS